jgi:hypothetical protein
MPAASFDKSRFHLAYWGPMFLLSAIICASLARAITPRFSWIAAPGLMLAAFFATGHALDFTPSYYRQTWARDTEILNRLDAMRLDSSTRLYASPNDHLILTFYSGLPIQSIAPVRKSFLDSYPDEIVYVDTGIATNTGVLLPQRIGQEALRQGQILSPEAAERWSYLLRTRDYREAILKIIDPGRPPQLGPLPQFAEELLAEERSRLVSAFPNTDLEVMVRGFPIRTWLDWRTAFEYRFVNPAAHSGSLTNYADRLRGARAMLLSSEAAIYRSRWHSSETSGSIDFQLFPDKFQMD